MNDQQERRDRTLILSNRQFPAATSVVKRGLKLAEALLVTDGLSDRQPPTTTASLARRGIILAEELLVTDQLTKLANLTFLNLYLRRESKRALSSGRPLSLIFIELDGFKSVNDTHGDLLGSRALVEAAAVIRGSAHENHVVARWGGDCFAVALPDTGGDGAFVVGDRIRTRIAAHQFLARDGLNIRLTASVGRATLPDVAASVDELVQAADKALSAVKESGRNGVQQVAVVSKPIT